MRRSLLGVVLVAAPALACSGPGAHPAMFRNTVIGYAEFALSLALTVSIILMTGKVRTTLAKAAAVVAVLLVMVHPGLILGVASGDCGFLRVFAGGADALLHVLITFILFLAWRIRGA